MKKLFNLTTKGKDGRPSWLKILIGITAVGAVIVGAPEVAVHLLDFSNV